MFARSFALAAALSAPCATGQATACLSSSPGSTFLPASLETQLNWVYAIRLKNDPTARSLTAVEIFTGARGANTGVEIFGHDPVNDAPAGWRAQASWWMSETVGWQGGVLSAPVALAPNEVFWLVWAAPLGAQLSVEALSGAGQAQREGRLRPSGPLVRKYVWKYRLWCGGKTPGEFVTLGGPCAGSNGRGPRMLADPSVPAIGAPFAIRTGAAAPNAAAALSIGLQDQRLGGSIPLPLELSGLGAPTCYVHVDVLATVSARTDAAGAATVPLLLPPAPMLIGRSVFVQWMVFDPAANALGLATSAGADCRLGN